MRIRQVWVIVLLLTLLSTTVASGVVEGPPEPGAAPDSTSSYSLKNIYERLDAGTAGASSTWAEPLEGPSDTMRTLNEIMDVAPAVDDTNGATAAQVLSGKTYWSLRSGLEWGGGTTGSMPNIGQQNITPGTTAQTISAGYHDGTGSVAGDADLVAGNIKSGVNLFGVDGSLTGGGTYNAAVPKTGDTYDDACCTGEDGELQKGVAWPNPRFTDNGDGTVTDNLTGLIWLKDASCADLAGTNTNGQGNWTTALSAANALASGSCGLTDSSVAGDWRLPSRFELESLLHLGVHDPAIPNTAGTGKWAEGDPFTGVQSYHYWSSTSVAVITDRAWFVFLGYGNVSVNGKASSYYAWPVRGGQ